MPTYEYHCDKCQREVTVTMSIGQHEKGKVKCPKCGSQALRPLLSTFMSQTAKKSCFVCRSTVTDGGRRRVGAEPASRRGCHHAQPRRRDGAAQAALS